LTPFSYEVRNEMVTIFYGERLSSAMGGGCGSRGTEGHMNTEETQAQANNQWEIAEERRVEAEGERERFERSRQDAEKQRYVMENRRQVTEKEREIGERLRDTERIGERLAAEYSTSSLLAQIESFEEQIPQFSSRLESIEALFKAMQEQLSLLITDKEKVGQES
jgi:hypothetical protein